MQVILFGATGMVGQGVLRECLADTAITGVLVVGRTKVTIQHPKLKELLHRDFTDFSTVRKELTGYDACFYCLGISSAGMNEADYRRVTYDYTIAAATTLVQINPEMTFVFISGAGTDSSASGRTMWARVKGATENALLKMPFRAKYMLRPAYIQPMDGITSKTQLYAVLYKIVGPIFPLLKIIFPNYVTTTQRLGRSMIALVKQGAGKNILENADINALVESC